jgi:hypothetical protein
MGGGHRGRDDDELVDDGLDDVGHLLGQQPDSSGRVLVLRSRGVQGMLYLARPGSQVVEIDVGGVVGVTLSRDVNALEWRCCIGSSHDQGRLEQ